MIKKISLISLLCLCSKFAMANQVDDFFRSMGKMYVVFGVIALIFLGLIFFLVRMEKRLSSLENETSVKKS